MSGDSPEDLIRRLRDQAAASVAGELVLEAAATNWDPVSDEEVDQAFRDRFEEPDRSSSRHASGRVRHGTRKHAPGPRPRPHCGRGRAVAPEQAAAREAIWTPDKKSQPPRRNCGPPVARKRPSRRSRPGLWGRHRNDA